MSDARLRTYYRTLTSRLTLPFVFTRCLCGCVLGFAAIAKTMDDASAPSLAIAQIEMGLAAWALTGGHDAILRRLLLCLFLVFATVNAVDALGGRDTCNCFGALNARPGAVALLDTTLAAILFISPPPPRWDHATAVATSGASAARTSRPAHQPEDPQGHLGSGRMDWKEIASA